MKFTVVLVDDDPVVLFLHQVLVKRGGLAEDTVNFKDGEQALKFILENPHEAPFLVLLDINMPVMDGWEFLDTLATTQKGDNIFVAIVSSSINNHDLQKARNYRLVVDYLEKPLSKDILLALGSKVSALALRQK